MAEISKEMSLLELLQIFPEAQEVLERHGMPCQGCMGSEVESIERGARMHGIKLPLLLQELNEKLAAKEKASE